MHDKRFPGESAAYRKKRDALLKKELELRDKVEEVARLRRDLPPVAPVPEDYVFEEGSPDYRDTRTIKRVKLSKLFAKDKDTLILINYMFGRDKELPCPMCTMWADTYDAAAPHISQRVNFALVAKAPLQKLRAWGAARGWHNLRLLSSLNNDFNSDYHGENPDGEQNSGITVFTRDADGAIRHFYSVEADFLPQFNGDPRHIDMYSPVWHLLDLTPEGRGSWYPRYSY